MMTVIEPAGFHLVAIVAALAAFAYLSWLEPRKGIYCILAGLPTYLIRLKILAIPTTFLELAILTLFAVWLLKGARWRRIRWQFWKRMEVENPIPPYFRLPLALLLVSALIAAIISQNQPAAFGLLKAYFFDAYLFLFVASYELRSEAHFESALKALGVLTLVIGAFAAIQYATGAGILNPFWADAANRRITTFFGYPNANSLLVAPIVALYLGYILKQQSTSLQRFKLAVILSGCATILMARTAGAAGALVIAVWCTLVMQRKIGKAVLGITLIALSLMILQPALRQKSERLFSSLASARLTLSSTSLEIRANQWRETFALLRERAVFGAGLAGYQKAVEPFHRYDFVEIYLYPHSLFLNFWVELGLLGLAAVVWLFACVTYALARAVRLLQEPRWLTSALIMAWLTVVVHGFVDVPYFKNDLSVLWMLLVAVTMFVARGGTGNPSTAGVRSGYNRS